MGPIGRGAVAGGAVAGGAVVGGSGGRGHGGRSGGDTGDRRGGVGVGGAAAGGDRRGRLGPDGRGPGGHSAGRRRPGRSDGGVGPGGTCELRVVGRRPRARLVRRVSGGDRLLPGAKAQLDVAHPTPAAGQHRGHSRDRREDGRQYQHPGGSATTGRADADGGADPSTHAPPTDRTLHQPEGQVGQQHREAQPDSQQRNPLERDVLFRPGDHVDRPVPEVEGVGADADPDERSAPERAAESCGGMGGGRHSQCRQPGDDREATVVHRGTGLGRLEEEHDHARDGGEPDHVEQAAVAADAAVRQRRRAPEQRQQRSDQQRVEPRVGAVVDAAGVGTGLVDRRHPHHARRRDRTR